MAPTLDATALHRDALVWDMILPYEDFGKLALKRTALDRMTRAGYNVVSLTLASNNRDLATTVRLIARERQFFVGKPERYQLVDTAADIRAAKAAGKLAVCFHFQDTAPFERSVELVGLFYRLGVRHALLAYNQKNYVGDGCHERTDGGLSQFGISLIREMNRIGMIVDCSHTGYRTTMDAFEFAEGPVIFSHSNPKALRPHARNITDDQARACAASGGVIGVNGVSIFLPPAATLAEGMFQAINYFVELVGWAHVGLGLDFVYDSEALIAIAARLGETFPASQGYGGDVRFADAETLPLVTELMVKHGYKEEEIKGILGANWLRVAERVWR